MNDDLDYEYRAIRKESNTASDCCCMQQNKENSFQFNE